MTSGGFEIDPAHLRQSGEQLVDVGDQVLTRWQALVADATGRGDIFGDDLVGGLIGTSYLAAQDIADESFTTVAEDLLFAGESLGANADAFETTEVDTTTQISGTQVT